MDTRHGDKQGRARTGGTKNEGPGAVLGPASIALAGAAIVAVVVATFGALATRDEDDALPTDRPTLATSAPTATEAAPEWTIYRWDPRDGGGILLSASAQLADPEFSPNGERLVYTSPGVDGVWQIHLLERGEHLQRLTDLPGGAYEPTWSPDGRQIAFSGIEREGGDADIFVMDADGTDVRRWFGTPRDDGGPDWSPDGSRVAFHSEGAVWLPGRLLVASVHTGAVRSVTGRFAMGDPAWSPDGRQIAFSGSFSGTINGRPASSQISLIRPNGDDPHWIGDQARSGEHGVNPSWSPDGRFIVFERPGGISIVDVRTARVTDMWSPAADPSWNRRGILFTVTGDGSLSPEITPDEFRVTLDIDTTITMTSSTCQLEGTAALLPGELTLELVNASRLDARFTMIRMAPGQTVADLQDDPGFVASMGRREVRYVRSSGADTWFTPQVVAGDRWAVACWRDVIPASNGIFFKPFRIVPFSVSDGKGG